MILDGATREASLMRLHLNRVLTEEGGRAMARSSLGDSILGPGNCSISLGVSLTCVRDGEKACVSGAQQAGRRVGDGSQGPDSKGL